MVKLFSPDDDLVTGWLVKLTSEITKATSKKNRYKISETYTYGTDYENDVFMMHRYCWCEREDCKWCSRDAPNFLHKKSGASITWYKHIGRGMEIDKADWPSIFMECLCSLR